jgi:hypothetical protein
MKLADIKGITEGSVKGSIAFEITKVEAYIKKALGIVPFMKNLKPKYGGPSQRSVTYQFDNSGVILQVCNDGYVYAGVTKHNIKEWEVNDLEELKDIIEQASKE